jgi:hypothetical protein
VRSELGSRALGHPVRIETKGANENLATPSLMRGLAPSSIECRGAARLGPIVEGSRGTPAVFPRVNERL